MITNNPADAITMKSMKNAFIFSGLLAIATNTFADKPVTTIGILVPIELPAMKQIVKGYETTLKQDSKTPVKFIVKNAQGDANIQRSILQEFSSNAVNIIAPIGTDAAQMSMAMIRNKPIVGIAADHLKENARKANNDNVTGVNSRTPPAQRVAFIHAALPALKKLTLVYSTDSRIYGQVNAVVNAAKINHISVQKLMVSQLSDLYTISQHIDKDSQGIFILKDETIVSGINTLVQQAQKKHIPVIASDDGSVAKGAAFALGVSEYQSGVAAAKVTLQIMQGKKAGSMPVHMMKHYFVFLNSSHAKKQGVESSAVKNAAKTLGYTVQVV